ncbi:MAG: hypothetical protein KY439_05810 [Actinobacteria bacterium]|nr:hypothetical protein [Actinomycetota bacterium]
MPRFGRKQPRTIPLETPSLHRSPQPDVDALHNQSHETHAFIQVARDHGRTTATREAAAPIVSRLVQRLPNGAGVDHSQAVEALTEAVCLGLGLADIETYSGMAPMGMSDVRIWNAVIMSKDIFSAFPEAMGDVLFFAVQAGYYVGRNGPGALASVLGASS